jgi:endonuclease/exonuclease/phosphatase family metal-dependent hydrolase
MTFNIRGAFFDDGANRWAERASLNLATIERSGADLIGLQEANRPNLAFYRARLAGYRLVTGSRGDKEAVPAYNAILWRPERLELLAAGGFYLSRTPWRWSSDWGSAFVRTAAWAAFRTVEGVDFLHVNTHLDHVSSEARLRGSEALLRQVERLGGESRPALITGDFNANGWTPPGEAPNGANDGTHALYLARGFQDAYNAAGHADSRRNFTYHAFHGESYEPGPGYGSLRIDWILARPGPGRRLVVHACETIRAAEPPLYPSDHYPVLAALAFEPAGP